MCKHYSIYSLPFLWNVYQNNDLINTGRLRKSFSVKMAVIVLIVSLLLDVVLVTHGQVYVFQNIEEHEQRISFLETSISNASTCCTSLKKENDLLKNQNQQLLLMMQNLSSQVSSLQQTMGALTTVSKTTVAPPTPPPATATTTIPVPTGKRV